MKQKSLFLLLFALTTFAIILGVVDHYVVEINSYLLTTSRWLVWVSMIYFAYQRRKLTTWIVVAMMLGCEIGFSFPTIAVHMDIFSGIFLRLIKTIIAPLIFSTVLSPHHQQMYAEQSGSAHVLFAARAPRRMAGTARTSDPS